MPIVVDFLGHDIEDKKRGIPQTPPYFVMRNPSVRVGWLVYLRFCHDRLSFSLEQSIPSSGRLL